MTVEQQLLTMLKYENENRKCDEKLAVHKLNISRMKSDK